ncbi:MULTISPECIES: hypothetical protein [Nostoc]|uniref:Uncharacterized protein n=2 Tax=Nostoc TaxID=1177 RepID=A0ABR8I3K7_9NOSO|nr:MULTISPECIES: hypothetical protein [Nostoc]MBD2559569.1 hypothetical protein [Nostoc linckia FACHB-391]MBD2645477.1 hypothetical protein [Nostoc foliaceum FACHB-393]
MDLEIVFNELSLHTYASDITTARQLMTEFINTILSIKPPSGSKRKLYTKSDFNYLELALDYRVVQWRNDPDVDLEARRFLKTLQDKNDLPLADILDPGIEVSYQGQQAIGLYYAFVFNSLAVSLKSEPQWDCSSLQLQVITVDEEEQEEPLIIRYENVLHASCSNHVQEHYDWIDGFQERIRQGVSDGLDLWNRRGELFPSLVFCESVSKQIQSLGNGSSMLRQIVRKLFELENGCKTWTDGDFNLDILASKATPESDSRLQKLEDKLIFKCPDDVYRLFSLHLRMTGAGAWRLHFSTELGAGTIIIGYIGPKIQ